MDGTQTNDESRREAAASVRPKPSSSRRPFLVLLALVALGLAVLGGYAYQARDREDTDDALVEADVVPLAARVGGAVRDVLVEENQRVKRGEPVFALDDTDFKLKLAEAEAELAVAGAQTQAAEAKEHVVDASAKGGLRSAQAQVSSSELNVQSAKSRVDVARAALEHAQADSRKAEIDLARTRALQAGNAVAQRDLDSAQASYDAAHAALTQAQAGLITAEDESRATVSHVADAQGKLAASTPIAAQIAEAHAQAELARAHEQAARSALARKQLELSYTRVEAPVDGLVSKLGAHPGQLVNANQPLAELVPNATYVVANFKETQIERMRPGNAATVELDAYPGRKFHGVVESLAGGTGARFSLLPPDNASGNFVKVVQRVPVRIAWKDLPGVPLPAGLSASVSVEVRATR